MALGLKLHLKGHTFYIVLFREILKESSCLKLKCLIALVLFMQHHLVDRYQAWSLYLTLSLSNATIVEFTGTVDSCLIFTVIRDANLCSLFQNVKGTY